MYWSKSALVLFGVLSTSSMSAPSPELIARTPGCGKVKAIISALDEVSTASAFCSAFLARTETSTVISTVVVPAKTTTTATTNTIDKTRTSHTIVTSNSTLYTSTRTITQSQNVTVTGNTTVTTTTCSFGISTATSPGTGTKISRKTGTLDSTPTPTAHLTPRQATSITSIASATTPTRLKGTPSAKLSAACSCFITSAPTVVQTSYSTISTTSFATIFGTQNVTTFVATTVQTRTKISTVNGVSTATLNATSTVTFTPTATVNYCGCHNEGLQWAIYNNLTVDSYGHALGDFSPEDFKTLAPAATGNTTSIGGINEPSSPFSVSIYGQYQQQDGSFFVLNHRGYIFANQTGTYIISVTGADDVVEVWVNNTAYSGWSCTNHDLAQAWGQSDRQLPIKLTQGDYTALRVVYGQGDGAAEFAMTITAPDGTVVLGPDTTSNPEVVQFSCDGPSAPKFPAFGSET